MKGKMSEFIFKMFKYSYLDFLLATSLLLRNIALSLDGRFGLYRRNYSMV